MKISKITGLLFLSSVLAFSGFSADKLSQADIKSIVDKSDVFKNPTLKIINGVDRGDYFQLKIEAAGGNGNVQVMDAFVLKKGGEAFFGGGYKKNGEKLLMEIDKSVIQEGISFSFGKGKRHLYVMTNPDCPHCVDFEKKLEPVINTLENDFTVHVTVLNERSKKTAFILSGKNDVDKRERMHAVMAGGKYKGVSGLDKKNWRTIDLGKEFGFTRADQEKVSKEILKGNAFAKEIGVTSTPSVYTADFQGIRWDVLIKTLEKNKK